MSSEKARRFHSVNFGSKNTWDDWQLIPVKRPLIEFPKTKTEAVDIPAGDGEIDMSEALTGYPVFENRTGKLKFRFVDSPDYNSTLSRRNKIASYLHGRTMRMILDDEPDYYYFGRYELDDMAYKGVGDYADITISYNIQPYKRLITTSAEDWLWDPFSFETGIAQKKVFANIDSQTNEWQYIDDLRTKVGDMPFVPTITCMTGSFKCKLYDSEAGAWEREYTFPIGETYNPAFVIYYKHTRLAYKGVGYITFEFRSGAL